MEASLPKDYRHQMTKVTKNCKKYNPALQPNNRFQGSNAPAFSFRSGFWFGKKTTHHDLGIETQQSLPLGISSCWNHDMLSFCHQGVPDVVLLAAFEGRNCIWSCSNVATIVGINFDGQFAC
jgi:hypothetical protein